MKVKELKHILERSNDDDNVMVAIKKPHITVGAIPTVPVKYAFTGFDWESGKFIITPEENLMLSDIDMTKRMTELQEKLGWSLSENRGLKAEIKRLEKSIK
jgi:hypothetical protein